MNHLVILLAAAAMTVMTGRVASAGRLDDFEKKAGEKKPAKPEAKPGVQHDDSAFGSGTYPSAPGGESFLESFWFWVIASPFQYRYDDPSGSMLGVDGSGMDAQGGEAIRFAIGHRQGSPILPSLRADVAWQYIDSNLDAQDFRLEAGYRMLAFHGRHTRYTESHPIDRLDINQFYGVLRVGGSYMAGFDAIHGWELGLGLGGVQQLGNQEHSSGAVTVPIRIYPTEWFGIEFRPAWYRPQERTIGDYDLCAHLGWRYLQFQGGYRWLWLQGVGRYFDGPYAGLSLAF